MGHTSILCLQETHGSCADIDLYLSDLKSRFLIFHSPFLDPTFLGGVDPMLDSEKNFDFDPAGNKVVKATGGVITLVSTNSASAEQCIFEVIIPGKATRLAITARGKVSVTFNIHNEKLSPGQFLRLEQNILKDTALALASPHNFTVNVVGDINVPPPGSEKRKLDSPAAVPTSAGPPAVVAAELLSSRPYYQRWAHIFSGLTEIATDAHTHITTESLTTDTLDRIFTSFPKSAGNVLKQTATVLNSPMFYLAKKISDHAPLIWTMTPGKPYCKGLFAPRQEWVKHPVFLEHSTKFADAIDFQKLSLEEQKECIVIITEASAKAARDAIAFAEP